jgi:hypothetical protein
MIGKTRNKLTDKQVENIKTQLQGFADRIMSAREARRR